MSGLVSGVEGLALLSLSFGSGVIPWQVAFERWTGLVGVSRAWRALGIEPGAAVVIVVVGKIRAGTGRAVPRALARGAGAGTIGLSLKRASYQKGDDSDLECDIHRFNHPLSAFNISQPGLKNDFL